MPDITHTWTEHTYTEPFTMTQEIRIPQSRHRLKTHEAYLWQCYTEGSPCWLIDFHRLTYLRDPETGMESSGYTYNLDPTTGDFWLRLDAPLAIPLRGTIVLTGTLEKGIHAC